jgi:hypothetical protein
MTNNTLEAKQMSKDEHHALRGRVRQFVYPMVKQEGLCPCCVARALIFSALDLGHDTNTVPVVAEVMRLTLEDIGDDARKPPHPGH